MPIDTAELMKQVRKIRVITSRLVNERFAGEYHSVFRGQGIEFAEVRAYELGDDFRAIDWNVSARMGAPFVKTFEEERELTLLLVLDRSGSVAFGRPRTKVEVAVEVAAVLALAAARQNDRVGALLFSDVVEHVIPPAKGRRHVLRVIREILFFEPKRRGTDLNCALEFLLRVVPHRAIAVVLSDFLLPSTPSPFVRYRRVNTAPAQNLAQAAYTVLRQSNRRHDVVAVQITDRFELELPALGRLVLRDAETGEVVEINTGDARKRSAFVERQARALADTARLFRSAGIDSIQLRTDQPYGAELAKFFETREKRRLRG